MNNKEKKKRNRSDNIKTKKKEEGWFSFSAKLKIVCNMFINIVHKL